MANIIDTVTACIDNSDPDNTGWAYRVEYDDGSQESGPMRADVDDESDAIIDELRSIVAEFAGGVAAGTWAYHESDGGYYVWTAA